MRALNRKLFRDLWRLRGQVIAIAMVVASGVAVLVMSLSWPILIGSGGGASVASGTASVASGTASVASGTASVASGVSPGQHAASTSAKATSNGRNTDLHFMVFSRRLRDNVRDL